MYLAVVAACLLGPVGIAHADVIMSTTGTWDGSFSISRFAQPNTSVYGQVLTAPAGTDTFDSISFHLQVFGGPIGYTAYVYAWDPINDHATGSALYTSSLQSLTDTGAFETVTITPNLAITPGTDYVAMLYANSGEYATWGVLNPVDGDGGYPAGFAYLNAGTNLALLTTQAWHCCYQSAFTARFGTPTPVPEPDSIAIAASGLLGFWLLARRKQRKRA